MLAERGINVDHATIHRWVVHFSPLLLDRFNWRKRTVTMGGMSPKPYQGPRSWTYQSVLRHGQFGDIGEFIFRKSRDLLAAKCFFRRTLECHSRPERVAIDGAKPPRSDRLLRWQESTAGLIAALAQAYPPSQSK